MKKRFFLVLTTISILFFVTALTAKSIQVISFNDFHGAMAQEGSNPGMAKFVTAVKNQIKDFNGKSIVVSAGDNYQGTALSVLTYGEPVNEMLKELNIAASVVGNHEFDWGIDKITEWSEKGGFPYLAANIIDKKTGKPVSWAKPYKMVTIDGVKIAFIGLTTLESATKTSTEIVKGLEFTKPERALKKCIAYLESGKDGIEKPDVIIALTHIASYQDKESKVTGNVEEICEEVKGVNAVISGHSHQKVCGYINNVPVVQAYKYGRSLGILTIQLATDNKLEKITPSMVSVTKEIPNLKNDPEAEKIFDKYNAELKKIDKVIGTAEKKLVHDNHYKGVSSVGEFVCKAMAEQTDSQIAITNGGGLRCSIGPGNITISKMYDLMPFDNYVMTMQLKGKDIKRIIEHGLFNPDPDTGDAQFYGIKVYYNSEAPYLHRIESMTLLDGTQLEMNKYYKVATIDFIFTGGDGYNFKGAKDVKDTYISLRDLIIKQIEKEKNIKAKPVDYLIDTAKEMKKAA